MYNTLSQANSPYLLQHQNNPVHWQQWTDEVLALAKEQDKPILLSVGYSSCHWCHVMAHESFEDQAVADVMNQHFINIKLDREERPDLDKTYQLAHQLLNRQAGGWPLTVVLDPQTLVPFFSGTYFPKEPRFGLPAFTELLQKISAIFEQKRDDIEQQNERLTQALQTIGQGQSAADNRDVTSLAEEFTQSILNHSDKRFGGMEGAPKFPQPAIWHSLLHIIGSGRLSKETTQSIEKALQQSLYSFSFFGLFDHLGGGFFRYCVDERWEIPHFEKMLYDNGQLLNLMSQAAHYFADGQLMQSVNLTLSWLEEQMLAPEGGFYSALDADSQDEHGDKHEGAYYCWQQQDFEVLKEQEFDFAKKYYGLEQEANFEGQWHLVTRKDWREVADECHIHEKQAPILMESARQQLKMVRDKRPLPFRDDKLLTSWNGLVLQGLLQAKKAGVQSEVSHFIESCKRFINEKMWQGKQLMACYKNGQAYQRAFLDDYGYCAKALLMSLSDDFQQQDWVWLEQLCDVLWQQFADQENGGFYFTSNQHDTVIARHKSWSDDAMPSSACQALEVMWVVAEMTNNQQWFEFVEKSMNVAYGEAKEAPMQHPSAINLIEKWQQGLDLWVLRGEAVDMPPWHQYLTTGLAPNRWVFAIEKGVNDKVLESKFAATDLMVAYCCREGQCFPAIEDFDALKDFA